MPILTSATDDTFRILGEQSGTLGFVPTMGALHAGHASLIELAAKQCDSVVVSIFVNPAQFGEDEDFDHYPRTLEADIEVATAAGTDYIFVPNLEEVYPDYPVTSVLTSSDGSIKVSPLTVVVAQHWEGEFRPNHFEGVVAVVKRLFEMVKPDKAYFGEKDYQQLRVIEDMVYDLNLPVEIVPCPTLRDENGLALSSRNRYLSAEERVIAQSIYQALHAASTLAAEGIVDVKTLLSSAAAILDDRIEVDYLVIVDSQSLEPLESLAGTPARILFAGKVGTTRLIDNLAL